MRRDARFALGLLLILGAFFLASAYATFVLDATASLLLAGPARIRAWCAVRAVVALAAGFADGAVTDRVRRLWQEGS
jgi:hypothetical protein